MGMSWVEPARGGPGGDAGAARDAEPLMRLCTWTSVVFSLMPSARADLPVRAARRRPAPATSSCRGGQLDDGASAARAAPTAGRPARSTAAAGHGPARVPLVLRGGRGPACGRRRWSRSARCRALGLGREGGGPLAAGSRRHRRAAQRWPRRRGRAPPRPSPPGTGRSPRRSPDLVVQPQGAGEERGRPVDVGGAPPAYDRAGEQAGTDRDGPVVVDRVEQLQRLGEQLLRLVEPVLVERAAGRGRGRPTRCRGRCRAARGWCGRPCRARWPRRGHRAPGRGARGRRAPRRPGAPRARPSAARNGPSSSAASSSRPRP